MLVFATLCGFYSSEEISKVGESRYQMLPIRTFGSFRLTNCDKIELRIVGYHGKTITSIRLRFLTNRRSFTYVYKTSRRLTAVCRADGVVFGQDQV